MVHEVVRRALDQMKLGKKNAPIWLDTIQKLHPPIKFSPPSISSQLRNGHRKPILPTPKPPKIVFAEDRHRHRLYKTHRQETIKPVLLAENNANNLGNVDSSPTIDRVISIQLEIMEENPKISIDKAYELALEQYEKEKIREEIKIKIARQAWNDTVIKMNAQNTFSSANSIIEENLKREKEVLENHQKENGK